MRAGGWWWKRKIGGVMENCVCEREDAVRVMRWVIYEVERKICGKGVRRVKSSEG